MRHELPAHLSRGQFRRRREARRLAVLPRALKRKDAAFFALDSHAGRGFYDLQAPEAQKSGEAERGVQRLIVNALGEQSLADYFSAIHARRGKRLPRYPGSPALIAQALRAQDRACSWS